MVALAAAVGGLCYFWYKSEILTLKCGDFSIYEDAVTAMSWGNTHLDGNDDGEPCESLK